ncbi:MAG: C69 family dipeptidase [Chitinophagales bacterium]|nr:C69 family dipeptidase [Chitinophagales bacterium]
MCDTFYIPAHMSVSGFPVLAKNSDREPNEAQNIDLFPAHEAKNSKQRCTFIEVEHPQHRYSVMLSKPFQMWGAEMGVNEHGLAIGNEAVFTKMKFKKDNSGLTGMDMLRLALESCTNAEMALEKIVSLLEQYGQDACGGYTDKNFYYHNSFLIADREKAFILETAGQHWVYRQVTQRSAISNRLSITTAYDGISKDTVDYATKKGWTKQKDFSFADAFAAPFMSRLAKGAERQYLCHTKIDYPKHKLDTTDIFEILRTHHEEKFEPQHAGMNNLCLHASGLFTPSQTTGSMVAMLGQKKFPVWFTGTAASCLSIYKPFYFDSSYLANNVLFTSTNVYDESYWWQWEKFHRRALPVYQEFIQAFTLERNQVQQEIFHLTETQYSENVSDKAVKISMDFLQKWTNIVEKIAPKKMPFSYNYHWKKWNKQAKII